MKYDYRYLYLMNNEQLRTVYRNTLNDLRTEFSLNDKHGQIIRGVFPDEDPRSNSDIIFTISGLEAKAHLMRERFEKLREEISCLLGATA